MGFIGVKPDRNFVAFTLYRVFVQGIKGYRFGNLRFCRYRYFATTRTDGNRIQRRIVTIADDNIRPVIADLRFAFRIQKNGKKYTVSVQPVKRNKAQFHFSGRGGVYVSERSRKEITLRDAAGRKCGSVIADKQIEPRHVDKIFRIHIQIYAVSLRNGFIFRINGGFRERLFCEGFSR